MGTYDVQSGKSGMFGLVFDNTFSKQTSKTATFVLLTYPTGAPPQGAHHLPNLQAGPNASASKTSLGKHNSPRLGAVTSDSFDSLHSHAAGGKPGTSVASISGSAAPANYHVGTLLKRRRKKGQGHARRFFSLDYATCTLSYYYNRNSSALRGAIPLSLAAIAADEMRREITIDSGAEVWHLKAGNAKEFTDWAHALERASRIARGLEELRDSRPSEDRRQVPRALQAPPNTQQEEDREWQQVEALVSRIVGTRDALRRLVKDMAAQKHTASHLSPGTPALSEDLDSYFQPAPEKRPFWKRKASSSPLTPQSFTPTVSSALAVPSPGTVTTITANGGNKAKRKSKGPIQEEKSMQDHCNALLGDLDTVVLEFSTLLSNSKRRRIPIPGSAVSRKSYDSSTSVDEFFDATEGNGSQLLVIDRRSEEDTPGSDADDGSIHDSSSASSVDGDEEYTKPDSEGSDGLFPSKPKSLAPLPITETISRRTTIPPATVLPPSLIAFVRKNVGKDLSTISMPVSANEPTSLLQRMAEQLEYAHLLEQATKQKRPQERLLYIAAFAVSQFSAGRAKERAIRKPFNPLLGETFELLRPASEVPGGLRLLVEKVSHRPVRLAMHADSASWSFAQAPAPTQKFWGKSAEITTEGRARVVLRLPDGSEERYSWNTATVFLRNVVMGEKYVEPVGTMHVSNESNGARAAIEFRSKGMFGGRGEDVQVETFEASGMHTGTSLAGTWTQSLRIVEAGRSAGPEIWRAGKLVDNAAQVYGLTAFAASLNEITPLEKGKAAPTDSRMRPDQRLAEEGKLDDAEKWKVKLEEAQRARRRVLEESGEEWRPRWFVKVADGADGDEVWRLKGGKEGYWEERAKGTWTGVEDIFAG
jgi:oxysterol-binding protein-related protein 3/6/7